MKGVEIENLENVKKDERGSILQTENRNCDKFLIVKRKAGTVSGKHYHEGKVKEKDPETIIFLDGKMKLILRNMKTNEELVKEISEPTIVKLDPYIYHEVRAITDIILLDMNSIEDDNKDTIKV